MVGTSRSSDMNPTDHLWDVKERSFQTQDPALKNIMEHWLAIEMT